MRADILTTCLTDRLTLPLLYVLQVSLIPQGSLGDDISGAGGSAARVKTPRIRKLQGVILARVLTALRKPGRPSTNCCCCFHHIGIIQRINFNNTVNQKIILFAIVLIVSSLEYYFYTTRLPLNCGLSVYLFLTNLS